MKKRWFVAVLLLLLGLFLAGSVEAGCCIYSNTKACAAAASPAQCSSMASPNQYYSSQCTNVDACNQGCCCYTTSTGTKTQQSPITKGYCTEITSSISGNTLTGFYVGLSGQSCTNACSNPGTLKPSCPNGRITSTTGCLCGGILTTDTNKYCCDGYLATSQCGATGTCTDNILLTAQCNCAGQTAQIGQYCCGTFIGTNGCAEPPVCNNNDQVTTECKCGNTRVTSGYCCNNIPKSSPCQCFNNQKDISIGETDVDCGGQCKPCAEKCDKTKPDYCDNPLCYGPPEECTTQLGGAKCILIPDVCTPTNCVKGTAGCTCSPGTKTYCAYDAYDCDGDGKKETTTPCPCFTDPQGPGITSATFDQKFNVKWGDSCSADKYELYVGICSTNNCNKDNAQYSLVDPSKINPTFPDKDILYTDSNVKYSSRYYFKIKAYYNINTNNKKDKTSDAFEVRIGDKVCYEKTKSKFCLSNSDLPQGSTITDVKSKVFYCDQDKNLKSDDCLASDKNSICVETSTSALCKEISKDACETCNNPFQLYGIGGISSPLEIITPYELCDSIPVCYLDKTETIADKYYSCVYRDDNLDVISEVEKCEEYNSKTACELDKCGVAKEGCIWKYTQQELGKGHCSPIAEEEQDCSSCGTSCTKDKCEAIGSSCVFANNECVKESDFTCNLYTTQQECGTTSAKFDVIYSGTPKKRIGDLTKQVTNERDPDSNDLRQLKVCSWKSDQCMKDADGNDARDPNQKDMWPPKAELMNDLGQKKEDKYYEVPNFNFIISANDILDGAICTPTTDTKCSGIKKVYYKIVSGFDQFCYPDKDAVPSNGNYELIQSDRAQQDGEYTFCYYTEDNANNLEVVNKLNLKKIVKPIDIEVTYAVQYPFGTQPKSTAIITIVPKQEGNSVDAKCTDLFTGKTPQIDDDLGSSFVVSYTELDDAIYDYKVTCENEWGKGEKEIKIGVFSNPEIIGFSPNGAVDKREIDLTFKLNADKDCYYKQGKQDFDMLTGTKFNDKSEETENGNKVFLRKTTINLFDQDATYYYTVKCDTTIKTPTFVRLTLDRTKPITRLVDIDGNTYDTTGWRKEYNDIFLECTDQPAEGFGCDNIKYSIGTSMLAPSTVYDETNPLPQIKTTKYLCYSSKEKTENGMGGASEDTKCVLLKASFFGPSFTVEFDSPAEKTTQEKLFITPKKELGIKVKVSNYGYNSDSDPIGQLTGSISNGNPAGGTLKEEYSFSDMSLVSEFRLTSLNAITKTVRFYFRYKDKDNYYAAEIEGHPTDKTLKLIKNTNVLATIKIGALDSGTIKIEAKNNQGKTDLSAEIGNKKITAQDSNPFLEGIFGVQPSNGVTVNIDSLRITVPGETQDNYVFYKLDGSTAWTQLSLSNDVYTGIANLPKRDNTITIRVQDKTQENEEIEEYDIKLYDSGPLIEDISVEDYLDGSEIVERGRDAIIKADIKIDDTNPYIEVKEANLTVMGRNFNMSLIEGNNITGKWAASYNTSTLNLGENSAKIIATDSFTTLAEKEFKIEVKDTKKPVFTIKLTKDDEHVTNISYGTYKVKLNSSEKATVTTLNLTNDFGGNIVNIDLDKDNQPKIYWEGTLTISYEEASFYEKKGDAGFSINAFDESDVYAENVAFYKNEKVIIDTRGPKAPKLEPSFSDEELPFYSEVYPKKARNDQNLFYTNNSKLWITGTALGAEKAIMQSYRYDGYEKTGTYEDYKQLKLAGKILTNPEIVKTSSTTQTANKKGSKIISLDVPSNAPVSSQVSVGDYIGFMTKRKEYMYYNEFYKITKIDKTGLKLALEISDALENDVGNEEVGFYKEKHPSYAFSFEPQFVNDWNYITIQGLRGSFGPSADEISIFYDPKKPMLQKIEKPIPSFTTNKNPQIFSFIIDDEKKTAGLLSARIWVKNKETNDYVIENEEMEIEQIKEDDNLVSYNATYLNSAQLSKGEYKVDYILIDQAQNRLEGSYSFGFNDKVPGIPSIYLFDKDNKPFNNPFDPINNTVFYYGKLENGFSQKPKVLLNFSQDSSVDIKNVKVKPNFPALVEKYQDSDNKYSLSWENLAENNYTISVIASKSGEQETGNYTFYLVVDKTDPEISKISFNSPIGKKMPYSYFNATIDGAIEYKYKFYMNNELKKSGRHGQKELSLQTLDLASMQDGIYNTKFIVWDASGNMDSENLKIEINNTRPSLYIKEIKAKKVVKKGNEYFTNSSFVEAVVDYNTNMLYEACYWNRQLGNDYFSSCGVSRTEVSSKPFSINPLELSIQQGAVIKNNITITAKDLAFNNQNLTFAIYTDLQAPMLTNRQQFNKIYFNDPKPLITFTFDEETIVKQAIIYYVNDTGREELQLDGELNDEKTTFTFTRPVNNLNDGHYEIYLDVMDIFGNSQTIEDLWFELDSQPGSGVSSISLYDIDEQGIESNKDTEVGHDTKIQASIQAAYSNWTTRSAYVLLNGIRFDLSRSQGTAADGIWTGTLNTKNLGYGNYNAQIITIDSKNNQKTKDFRLKIVDLNRPSFTIKVFDSKGARTNVLRVGTYTAQINSSKPAEILYLNLSFDYIVNGEKPKPIQLYWTKVGFTDKWTASFTIPRHIDYMNQVAAASFNIIGQDAPKNNGTFIEDPQGNPFTLDTKAPSTPWFEPSFKRTNLDFYGLFYPSIVKADDRFVYTNRPSLFVSGWAPGAEKLYLLVDESLSQFNMLQTQFLGSSEQYGLKISPAYKGDDSIYLDSMNTYGIIAQGYYISFKDNPRKAYGNYNENYKIASTTSENGRTKITLEQPLESDIAAGTNVFVYNTKFVPDWFGLESKTFEQGMHNNLYAYSKNIEESKSMDQVQIFMDSEKPLISTPMKPRQGFTTNIEPDNVILRFKDKMPSSNISNAAILIKKEGVKIAGFSTTNLKKIDVQNNYIIYEASFNSEADYEQGEYEIEYNASDKAGNTAEGSYKFYYYKNAPAEMQIRFVNSDGSEKPIKKHWIDKDIMFTNNDAKIKAFVEGKEIEISSIKISPQIPFQVSGNIMDFGNNAPESTYQVSFEANYVGAVQKGVYEFKLVFDRTQPVISNLKVTSPIKNDQTDVWVNATISGEQYAYSGTIDYAGRLTKYESQISQLNYPNLYVLGLNDGARQILLNVTDQAGNAKTTQSEFIIDSTKPILAIAGIFVNSNSRAVKINDTYWRINDKNPKINVSATDTSKIVSSCYENNMLPYISCIDTEIKPTKNSFIIDAELMQQEHDQVPNIITINAKDQAENTAKTNFTLSLDLKPPQIIDSFIKSRDQFDSPYPQMFVVFDEPAYVSKADLYAFNGTKYNKINLNKATADNLRHTFTSERLSNSSYILNLTYSDDFGNQNMQELKFYVNLKPLNVTLLVPRYKHTSVPKFNFTIQTSEEATCKFTKGVSTQYDMMEYSFTRDSTKRIHTFRNFTMDRNGVATSTLQVIVKCLDKFGFDKDFIRYNLVYDPEPTSITASFSPNPIVEYKYLNGQLKLYNDLTANTGKPAFCKATRGIVSQKLDGDNSTVHKATIVAPEDPRGVATYYYNVTCATLANVTRSLENVSQGVNLNKSLEIISISPPDNSFKGADFEFNVSTNKYAKCYYRLDSSEILFSSDSSENLVHRTYVTKPEREGAKRYTIKCSSLNQVTGIRENVSRTITIKFDYSAPVMSKYNATHCMNSFSLRFEASENLSTPVYFNYTILNATGGVVVPYTKTSRSNEYVSGLRLSNLTTYTVKVLPINSVGLSPNVWTQIEAIDLSQTSSCNYRPTSHCSNRVKDGDETGIDCGGSCRACNFNHCYDKKKNYDETDIDCGGSCGQCKASHCQSGTKNEDETGIDCGGADCRPCLSAQCSNNIKDGSETGFDCGGVCPACNANYCTDGIKNYDETATDCGGICGSCSGTSTCENGVKDGLETAIDCGGICIGCANGDSCLYDEDCDSGYCNSSKKCDVPLCENDKKDTSNGETDKDCGGSKCDDRCAEGEGCEEDEDCGSLFYCSGNKCTKHTCFDDIQAPNEADTDCGGICINEDKLCSVDQKCLDDADCESNSCSRGMCAEASCDDGRLNGEETGTDCGGDYCESRCGAGFGCQLDDDCSINLFCNEEKVCDSIERKDTDGDGIPDYWEDQYGMDKFNPDDANLDPDGDGIINLDEFKYKTKPNEQDSDGDGYSDGDELKAGTDPLDSESHPESNFLRYLLYTLLALVILGGGGYFAYTEIEEKKRKDAQKKLAKPMQPQKPQTATKLQPPRLQPMQQMARPVQKPIQKTVEQKPSSQKPAEKKEEDEWIEIKTEEKDKSFDKLSDISKEAKNENKDPFEQLKSLNKKKK